MRKPKLSAKAQKLFAELVKKLQQPPLPAAPWPPGVDWRVVGSHGQELIQIRPGAAMPHHWYLNWQALILERHTRQSRNPCMN